MTVSRTRSALCLLPAILLSPAWAQSLWHVDVNGTPPGSGSAANPYTSIQYAIDQGSTLDGDTLLVRPGTYAETLSYRGKAIEVRSSAGAGVTIVDAGGGGSVVRFEQNEGASSVLVGLTLSGGVGTLQGSARVGGGLFVSSASPTIRECVIVGNEAWEGGGGWFSNSSARVEDCLFEDNLAGEALGGGSHDLRDGGGLHASAGSNLDLRTCVFQANLANRGGGLFATGSTLTLDGCQLLANRARENVSSISRGGGLWVGAASILWLWDSTLDGNTAGDTGLANCEGGGIVVKGSTALLSGCQIRNNEASGRGCYVYIGYGGGLKSDCSSSVTITGCDFEGNQACYGGGLQGTADISDSRFEDNWATDGGALHNASASCSLTLSDCELIDNHAWHGDPTEWFGGGLYGPATATRCLIQGNEASRGGGTYGATLVDCDVIDNFAYSAGFTIGAHGGGVHGGSATNCRLRFNRCTTAAGVAFADSTGGAAFACTLTSCLLKDNEALQGGGAEASDLFDCVLIGNRARYGGGLAHSSAERSSLVGNTAEFGGAGYSVSLRHCSLTRNAAQDLGGGIYAYPFDDSDLTHCVLWNNTPSEIDEDFVGVVTAEWSDVQGGWGGSGNFSADPQFVNPIGADLHLGPGSACIDAGNPLDPPDPDGSVVDVGAFYFVPGWCALPGPYCSAKQTSAGDWPIIESSGAPTLAAPDDFHVGARNARPGQPGILFWGRGPLSLPFLGGTICVQSPQVRTPVQSASSGGATGSYDFFFSQAYLLQHGMGAGDLICAEYWFRDPNQADGTGVGFSDALAFVICP